jgi:hypothetical protein
MRFFICKNILKNYRVTMTTALDTSCSENTIILSEGEGFCMHVFLVIVCNYSIVASIFIVLRECKSRISLITMHILLSSKFPREI